MTRIVPLLSAGLAIAAMTGCSSTLPPERIAEPRASIRAATELGAQNNPQAALHLKLAQDQVAQADKLLKDGDKDKAGWMLMRADADAELALAITKDEKLKGEVVEAQKRIQDLKQKTQTNLAREELHHDQAYCSPLCPRRLDGLADRLR